MSDTPAERLKDLGARYWKPVLLVVTSAVAALNALKDLLKGLGLSVETLPVVAATSSWRWLVVAGLLGLVLLIRSPRLAALITRLVFGPPAAPPSLGRIFRGPLAYGRGDSLPGRQAAIDDCSALLETRRLLILEGESGCGKTSFLNAGLLPRARSRYRVIECRVADDPFGKLRAALYGRPYRPLPAGVLDDDLAEAIESTAGGAANPLLVCIDQFEELFVTIPDTIRTRFLAVLLEALRGHQLSLLVAIRGDFFDLLLKTCRAVDADQEVLDLGNYYTLGAFTDEQARAVLAELLGPVHKGDPLLRQQVDGFAAELVGELLRPPRDMRLSRLDKKTVLPVELQTVGLMAETVGLRYFSVAGFRELGGKAGLLRRYIEDAKTYVSRKAAVPADRALLILRELVSPAQTKWPQTTRFIAGAIVRSCG